MGRIRSATLTPPRYLELLSRALELPDDAVLTAARLDAQGQLQLTFYSPTYPDAHPRRPNPDVPERSRPEPEIARLGGRRRPGPIDAATAGCD